MTNNQNKLSKEDVCSLYTFLYEYEKDIKQQAGHYHIQDNSVKAFLSDNDIFIGALAKKTSKQNYICYDLRSGRSASLDDVGHHILRHVRNAIAHGLISKEKGAYFKFSDKSSKQKDTARAHIKVELFWKLIDIIRQTYR